MLNKRVNDWIVPLLLLTYSTYYYIEVRSLPNPDTALLLIEPMFFILMISVILYIGLQWLKKEGSEGKNKQDTKRSHNQLSKTIYFCVSTVLYVFLLDVFGFVFMTFLYCLFLMFALGVKSFKILLPIPILLTGILYLSLEIWLNIPLPKGLFY